MPCREHFKHFPITYINRSLLVKVYMEFIFLNYYRYFPNVHSVTSKLQSALKILKRYEHLL